MKALWTSPKTWGTAQEFVNDFPFARFPLVLKMFGIPETLKVPAWDRDKQERTQADIIEYAMSHELPVSVQVYTKDTPLFGQPQKGGALLYSPAIGTPQDLYNLWYSWAKMLSYTFYYPMVFVKIGAAYRGLQEAYNVLIVDTLFREQSSAYIIEAFNAGSSQRAMPVLNWVRANREGLINFAIKYGIAHFEARIPETKVEFREMYGAQDFREMSPRTISYLVTKDPPPYEDAVPWDGAEFWSEIFNTDEGRAVLQAVASNYPVKTRVASVNWQEAASTQISTYQTGDYTFARFVFQYVFSDFVISIDKDLKIIVKYQRSRVNESQDILLKKRNAFKEILVKTMFAAAVTIIAISAAGAFLGPEAVAEGGAVAAEGGEAATATVGEIGATAIGSAEAGGGGILADIAGSVTLGGVTKAAGGVLAVATGVEKFEQAKALTEEIESAGDVQSMPPTVAESKQNELLYAVLALAALFLL